MSQDKVSTISGRTVEKCSKNLNKRRESSFILLIILTVGFFIGITGFTAFTKAALNESISDSTRIADMRLAIPPAKGLGEEKTGILKALYYIIPDSHSVEPEYVKFLKEYIVKPESVITPAEAWKVKDRLEILANIIRYEKTTDIAGMSIDGRRVALHLTIQIYEYCGLKPSFGTDSNIDMIKDMSGNILYDQAPAAEDKKIHITGIAVTLIVLPALWLMCFSIAKRNRLFVKEVYTDGFDKEKYA